VAAFVDLVVIDEFGIRPLCPTPWGWIDLVRKDAHGNRDGDTFGSEIREFSAPMLPVETGARKRRVRQPRDRDVVEDIVAREALGVSLKDAFDQLVAASSFPNGARLLTREGVPHPKWLRSVHCGTVLPALLFTTLHL
jgi:hypothetical protein